MTERLSQWLTQWRPVEVIALVGVVGLTAVLLWAVKSWRRVRETQAGAEREKELFRFKQEMSDRGLSPEDIEKLVPSGPPAVQVKSAWSDEQVLTSLARNLTSVNAPPPVIEEILTRVREADPASRRAAAQMVNEMVIWQEEESKVDAEQLLGVVRGLCRPADPRRGSALDTTLDKVQV